MLFFRFFLLGVAVFGFSGCTGLPNNVQPVKNFDVDRYVGTWFEIARLDHPFERGLERISATYSLREDGGVSVLNKGFNVESRRWDEAEGKAYFVLDESVGHLKVSFFGPFYSSYVVAYLDEKDYQYAIVTGPNTDYFWILSRTPNLEDATLTKLLSIGSQMGFDMQSLIYVNHDIIDTDIVNILDR